MQAGLIIIFRLRVRFLFVKSEPMKVCTVHTCTHVTPRNTHNVIASIQRDVHQTSRGLVKESDSRPTKVPGCRVPAHRSDEAPLKKTCGSFANIASGSREDSGSLLLLLLFLRLLPLFLPSSASALVMHSPESGSSRRGVLPSNLF